jgi:hypothetical protein
MDHSLKDVVDPDFETEFGSKIKLSFRIQGKPMNRVHVLNLVQAEIGSESNNIWLRDVLKF